MIFSNLKIGQRLGLGFGIVIALMLAISIIGATQIARVSHSVDGMANDLYPKTVMANAIKGELNETARSMRNLLLLSTVAEVKAELATIDRAGKNSAATLAAFDKLSAEPEGRRLLADVIAAREKYQPVLANFVKLVNDGQVEQAKDLALPEIAPHQLLYFKTLDRLITYQSALMDEAGKNAGAVSQSTRAVMLVLAVMAMALAAVVGLWSTRAITRPLNVALGVARKVASGDLTTEVQQTSRDETGQLLSALKEMNQSLVATVSQVRTSNETIGSAARDIAAGNQHLSNRTETQASSLQKTASSIATLTATVRQNAEHASHANALMMSSLDFAVQGGDVVDGVVATMTSIKESSRRIVDIISVIDGIAFQTNILALNAAVEAARAGEQGRGFAVVAAEVRNLAQRSAAAAKEIKLLIGDSVEKVDAGDMLAGQAGKSMQDIVSSVRHVATIISEISAASKEQSTGIEQVNQAVGQIDDMTQQNAALVEQASAAVQVLQDQAQILSRTVAVFTLSQENYQGSTNLPLPPAPASFAPYRKAVPRLH